MALVGAGHMGRLHALKIRALEEAGRTRLVAVVDLDAERAAEVAAEAGGRPGTALEPVLPDVDALVVAVPTESHFRVVRAALEAGVDVLVEKPIAASLDEAQQLLQLAHERSRVLQVGHLEWFNAAMRTVASRIRRPRFIEAHRMGPFPARGTDVDVVRDLMIHDLDIVLRLLGEEPSRIDSIGVPVVTDRVDIANARLGFPGGCVANLTASRVSPTPMRKIRFFQPDGYFSIDFLEQAVVLAQRGPRDASGEREVHIERLDIDREDALLNQLESFCEAVATRKVGAGAADSGLAALRIALRVVSAMPALEIE